MGYLHDETEVGPSQARVFAATIVTDAVDTSDLVDVVIPNFDPDVRWTDVQWQTRGNELPKRGDSAVVVMDDDDQLWIVGWTTGVRIPRTVTRAYASGPPSDPIDQDVWVATEVTSAGEFWQFQYDSSDNTYPWKFLGGSSIVRKSFVDDAGTTSDWTPDNRTNYQAIRAGEYEMLAVALLYDTGGIANEADIAVQAGNTRTQPWGTIAYLPANQYATLTVLNTVTAAVNDQLKIYWYGLHTNIRDRSLKITPRRIA